eukprot:m.171192 g.171192  ORF g.171192 m.171192 type:complete len:441 (-) comp31639_c1_seq1:92-1414(-)
MFMSMHQNVYFAFALIFPWALITTTTLLWSKSTSSNEVPEAPALMQTRGVAGPSPTQHLIHRLDLSVLQGGNNTTLLEGDASELNCRNQFVDALSINTCHSIVEDGHCCIPVGLNGCQQYCCIHFQTSCPTTYSVTEARTSKDMTEHVLSNSSLALPSSPPQAPASSPFAHTSTLRRANISGRTLSYRAPDLSNWSGVVYGVLSISQDYDRRQNVRKTWGTNQTLYLLAGPWATVSSEMTKHGDILWLDIPELYNNGTYSSLTYKSQTFFHAVSTLVPDVTYVVKTDDDSFIFTDEVSQMLRHEEKKPPYLDYWGFGLFTTKKQKKGKWGVSESTFPDAVYPPYVAGAGYMLSKKFLTCATSHLPDVQFIPIEDAATGLLAKTCNITIYFKHPEVQHGDATLEGDKQTGLIIHYVKTREKMMELWQVKLWREKMSMRYRK